MCNEGRNIVKGDTIFVSLTQNGRSKLTFCSREFGSFAELVKGVYQMANGCMGMATMSVRNRTQGWSCRMPLMLVAQQLTPARVTRVYNYHLPQQQELPFAWS